MSYYDEQPDKVPALIRASTWECLDCDVPLGESVTDYSPEATAHHHKTGHRVNGSIVVRYRAIPVTELHYGT